MTVLLDLYEAHMTSLLPRREELMKKQTQCAHDTDEQWELLRELAACQVGLPGCRRALSVAVGCWAAPGGGGRGFAPCLLSRSAPSP